MESNEETKPVLVSKKYNVAPDNILGKIKFYTTIFLKRMFDIIGSIIGIILMLPLTLIVVIMNIVYRESGPIFYTHVRLGKNGKHFKMYKYRTMVVNADEILEEILAGDEKLKEEFEKNRKMHKDPRVTKAGKILRKTSLDEVPQFINVLKGEMSLIGPRAVVDGEIEKFGNDRYKIFSVKPGITGYWASHGRSNTTYEERVAMEKFYAEHISIFLDIKIIFKTFLMVFKREGAV
ncbi:MAG: sugar transferase [Candidatus Scatovivens sp.]